MPSFPILKSGAVAQYPLGWGLRFTTGEVAFLDGSRQTYQLRGRAGRRWLVRLDQLGPEELNSVIDFAEAQTGETFPFVDPLSGDTIAHCVIAESGVGVGMSSEAGGHAVLAIEEVV